MLSMRDTSVRRYDSCSIMSPRLSLWRYLFGAFNELAEFMLLYCFAHTFGHFIHSRWRIETREAMWNLLIPLRENKQKREEKLPFATSLKIISFQLRFKPIECLLSFFIALPQLRHSQTPQSEAKCWHFVTNNSGINLHLIILWN